VWCEVSCGYNFPCLLPLGRVGVLCCVLCFPLPCVGGMVLDAVFAFCVGHVCCTVWRLFVVLHVGVVEGYAFRLSCVVFCELVFFCGVCDPLWFCIHSFLFCFFLSCLFVLVVGGSIRFLSLLVAVVILCCCGYSCVLFYFLRFMCCFWFGGVVPFFSVLCSSFSLLRCCVLVSVVISLVVLASCVITSRSAFRGCCVLYFP